MKRYEAMFLFDNTNVHQWAEMEAECRRLFERIGANVLVCVKFDERKLAYEIKGRKRGTYVLTYFDADPERIDDLERDGQLSELILRLLVLRVDKLNEEELAKLQAHPAEQPLQPTSGDGRRGDGPPRGRSDSRSDSNDADGRDGDRFAERHERPRRAGLREGREEESRTNAEESEAASPASET